MRTRIKALIVALSIVGSLLVGTFGVSAAPQRGVTPHGHGTLVQVLAKPVAMQGPNGPLGSCSYIYNIADSGYVHGGSPWSSADSSRAILQELEDVNGVQCGVRGEAIFSLGSGECAQASPASWQYPYLLNSGSATDICFVSGYTLYSSPWTKTSGCKTYASADMSGLGTLSGHTLDANTSWTCVS